jgi:hypothetical protein
MPENTAEKKSPAQLSFRLDEGLKRKFDAKLGLTGQNAKDVLTGFVTAYTAEGGADTRKRPAPDAATSEGVASGTDLSHADITAGLTDKQIEQVEAFVRLLRLDHPELSAMAEGLLGMSEREYQSREKKDRRNQKAG